jgi:hypothetical protein
MPRLRINDAPVPPPPPRPNEAPMAGQQKAMHRIIWSGWPPTLSKAPLDNDGVGHRTVTVDCGGVM